MAWLTAKVRKCIDIIQKASPTESTDPTDFVEEAFWSKDPEVRSAHGYLEAVADILDLTVSEMVSELRAHGKRTLTANGSIALGR